jgi:hypothetical protein
MDHSGRPRRGGRGHPHRRDTLPGATPPLTAGQALTFDDVATTLTELTGREIRREVIDDKDFVSTTVSTGMPEGAAKFSLSMFLAVRARAFATVDPTLEQLLGRAPSTLKEVLAGHQPR